MTLSIVRGYWERLDSQLPKSVPDDRSVRSTATSTRSANKPAFAISEFSNIEASMRRSFCGWQLVATQCAQRRSSLSSILTLLQSHFTPLSAERASTCGAHTVEETRRRRIRLPTLRLLFVSRRNIVDLATHTHTHTYAHRAA